MIDGQNVFEQPVKNDLRTYDNSRKIEIGHRNDYTTGCLLDYSYFKEIFKLITIDLSKEQALDTGPKAIQQINFAGDLARNPIPNTTMFLLLKNPKKPFQIFQKNLDEHCHFILF